MQPPDLRHISFAAKPARQPLMPPPRWAACNQTGADLCGQPVAAQGAAPAADAPVPPLAAWVLQLAGLDAQAYRGRSLDRRVAACLRALKVHSEEDARRLIADQPRRLPTAVNSLLIGVTGFFRDPDVFDAIRRVVIPSLRQRGGPIRIWSAGCASGAELYSMAIILAEAGLLERSELLGTDCRPDVVDEARNPAYEHGVVHGLGQSLLDRYFEPTGSLRWQPVARVRERIAWKTADVLRGAEPGPWDIIFWRNVAIYLNPVPAATVADRLIAHLARDGFLVLGKAERPPASDGRLMAVHRCVYRKA